MTRKELFDKLNKDIKKSAGGPIETQVKDKKINMEKLIEHAKDAAEVLREEYDYANVKTMCGRSQ